jgi:DNA-directed RNA polymerase subunit beta'
LVDVAQDLLVREKDCKTKDYITLTRDDELFLITFEKRLLGRVVAEDVKVGRKVIAKRNEIITKEIAKAIVDADITAVKLRSPLVCENTHGICAACYGVDLGRNKPVEIGTPVGLLAAQSIGEPGTQLTLRTKHAGGIASSSDITQGLPRVEEVFEARTPKFEATMAPFDGKVSIVEEGESKKIILVGKSGPEEFKIPFGRDILVKDGDKVKEGTQLTEGYLDPKKMVKVLGVSATQHYLVNEALKVYSSHGSAVDDIHLEVIIRRMFDKIRVESTGDTSFIPGQITTRMQLEEENSALGKGKKAAKGTPVLLGITKSSLKTDSWLSAASFQETTRVLTEAAVAGKVDKLLGLKENVMIGRLIPTGERAKLEEK